MASVYVGMGSNVGDRAAHLQGARRRLDALPGTAVTRCSRVYETAPMGPVEQGAYLNAAVALETDLAPESLWSHCVDIEAEAGRPPVDDRVKWGPRTLDLDVLIFADLVVSTDRLVVPHPLLHERWFVLRPLVDLDPTLVHPVLQMTVNDLLIHLEETGDGAGEGFGRAVAAEA